MDSYYANQATSLPHFSGHYRQRVSGFGALAAGIGVDVLLYRLRVVSFHQPPNASEKSS